MVQYHVLANNFYTNKELPNHHRGLVDQKYQGYLLGQCWHLIVALSIKHDQNTQKKLKLYWQFWAFIFFYLLRLTYFAMIDCSSQSIMVSKLITMSYPPRSDIIHAPQISPYIYSLWPIINSSRWMIRHPCYSSSSLLSLVISYLVHIWLRHLTCSLLLFYFIARVFLFN